MADTIHGYTVVNATPYIKRRHCLDCRAVLVDKGDGELVTALQARDQGGPQREWFWGHYHRDPVEARADYRARARKLLAEARKSTHLVSI